MNRPSFVIAEISGNHGGRLKDALKLIEVAKKSGADAVKFQAYTANTITLNSNKKDFLIPKNNAWQNFTNLYELYQIAQTPFEWIPKLLMTAKSLEIPIFASVFDLTSVKLLEKYKISAYKIASPEVSDSLLLKAVAKTKKPIFISNGLADLKEMMIADDILRKNGAKQIYWMKANTSYPTPLHEVNLKTINHMSKMLNSIVGFSDHTLNFDITLAAVASGAKIIEKHIKLESKSKTVDDFFSLNPKDFAAMVKAIRNVEQAIGSVDYNLPKSSRKYLNGKRSLYVCQNIHKGDAINENNIRSIRPSFGLSTEYYDLILGAKVKRDLFVGDRVKLKDLYIQPK